jgi:uncharacterized protein
VAASKRIDLARLALGPGQGRRLEVEADPGELKVAGQRYALAPRPTAARLDVSRTAAGYALRLRFAGELHGACMRCLADAAVPLAVDAREVSQPGSGDEELASPYVADEVLDLFGWAHDALALALPAKVLCRPDCAGLCPVCGASLNDADPAEHRHRSAGDPRWEKLRELKLD